MDFMKALTFPFDDDNWIMKALIGCAIILGLGIVSFLVIPVFVLIILIQGYSYEIMKRVRNDHPEPLPAWDDFGGLMGQGFKLFAGSFIMTLPGTLIVIPALGTFLLPLLAVPLGEDGAGLAAGLGGLGIIAFWGCVCIAFFYLIFASINNFGAFLRFVDREEIGTFFQVKDNLGILQDNLGLVGTGILFLIGGGLITSVLSSTGIGGLVSGYFSAYFNGHIYGQLRKAIDAESGAPKPVDAPAV